MGITDRINVLADNAKTTTKQTAMTGLHIAIRVVTGLMIGLTLGLIFQELIGFGLFALTFFVVVSVGVTFKIMSTWGLGKILIFDLFCVLVAMLLRMYILVAP